MRSRAILLCALATIARVFGSLPDHAGHEPVASVQLPPLEARATQRRGSLDDPVTSLAIMYPLDGAIERPPVGINAVINIRQGGADLFRELYGDMRMCMEVNNVSVGCSRLDVPLTTPRQWTLGPCTVQIYLSQVDTEGGAIGQRFWESTPTSFTLVNDAEFALHAASFVHTKGSQHRSGYNLSLVHWAQRQQQERSAELLARLGRDSFEPLTTGQYEDGDDLVLVIGVKTAVASNFALRQAIRETWASKSSLPDGFDFDVENVDALEPLQVTTMIFTPTQAASKVSYFPSNETLLAYSHRVCAEARLSFPGAVNVSSCGEMVARLKAKLQGFYEHVQSSEAVELSRLALWKHNLFVDEQDALPMIVAYTTGASPSSIAFECIFASMGQPGPVLVIDETSLYRRYDGSPDVFVFSVLDGDCEYYIKPGCRQMVSDYLRRCFYSRDTTNSSEIRHPCSLMLLSGEAWDLKGLDDKILAVSTVANVLREKHVYLSMASMSFAERIDHNPNALLVSQRGERLEHPIPAPETGGPTAGERNHLVMQRSSVSSG
ncbi:Beta-1,3-galactosyltransferase 4 [Phytophthora pseudosyringae]|uniref:Beta-1,3-galactosyltransferase 4 n=1 Tax=Phytophthora pseudosyringae TaxID=221518 RepID=A0A8T1WH16_9STRA|nr:Beta-1,3-galactosyltransferase 4 [Phytophthora pseudosyringae]